MGNAGAETQNFSCPARVFAIKVDFRARPNKRAIDYGECAYN
jgi:hypothetical protein